jgi:hypothetical protein
MKTSIATLVTILISILSCPAQDFKFGVLAGLDLSTTQQTNLPDNLSEFWDVDPMITFNVNGYAGYKSAGIWGISVEPGFIQKGALHKSDDSKARFQLNYIHMPVLGDIYLLDKLFISVGPEFGWMINAKAKADDYTNDITEIYKNHRYELSGLIALNYELNEHLDIGIRYNHGLTNISKITYTDQLGNVTGESKEYNQYFQIILRFRISK